MRNVLAVGAIFLASLFGSAGSATAAGAAPLGAQPSTSLTLAESDHDNATDHGDKGLWGLAGLAGLLGLVGLLPRRRPGHDVAHAATRPGRLGGGNRSIRPTGSGTQP